MREKFIYYVYVDIHNFIRFNDQFGHELGDYAIEQLEQHFEYLNASGLKRLGGDKWRFVLTLNPDDIRSELKELKYWARTMLHLTLNIVLVRDEERRDKDALYLLDVATQSGGGLVLTLPYKDGEN